MDSSTRPITPFPIRAVAADPSQPQASAVPGEDLLLDARNLMSILGLYCDLLATPGVLQPEHRKYADDLRLVGARSEALIGRLMEQLTSAPAAERRVSC